MNWNTYFNYNEETGELIWKSRPRSEFRTQSGCSIFHRRFVGTVAGTKKYRTGTQIKTHVLISLNGTSYLAHNIIWEMFNGPRSNGTIIDHKDNDPWNNRRLNLRPSTRSQNNQNRRMPSHNTTGYKGVSYRNGRYTSKITSNKVDVYLGCFDTAEEAHKAYCERANVLHGEFAKHT